MISAYFDTSNQYIKFAIVLDVLSQEVANNRSYVRMKVIAWRTNTGYQSYGSGICYLYNYTGVAYSQSISSSQVISYNSDTVLYDGYFWVNHNADGTATPTFGAEFNISGIVSGSYNEHTFTLPTIPRTATLSSVSGVSKFGDTAAFGINGIVTGFYYVLELKSGSQLLTFFEPVTGSFNSVIDKAWQSYIPTALSMDITATLKTYADSTMATLIGSSSKTFTVGLSDDAYPSIASLGIVHKGDVLSPAVPSNWGMYVQGRSGAVATITGAAGAYGSSIVGYAISGGGYSGGAAVLTIGVINQAGTVQFAATITDSRGRSASKTASISVVPYSPPTINSALTQRANSSQLPASDGLNALAEADYGYTSLGGNNAVLTKVRYRESGAASWTDGPAFGDATPVFLAATFAADKSYDVAYTVEDYFSTSTVIDLLSKVLPMLEFNPAGEAGVGREPVEGKSLAVGGAADIDGELTIGTPLAVTEGGTGATTAVGARSALGLGAAALLGSPIPVANGGTGATSAADARSNLGFTDSAYTTTASSIITAGVCDVNDAGATIVDGICHIGVDGNKTDATDVTTSTVLWTIAAAYRPKATVQVPCWCKLADNTPRFRRAIIHTDGTITLNAAMGTGAFDATVCAAYSVME